MSGRCALGQFWYTQRLFVAVKEVRDAWKQISVLIHDVVEALKVGTETKRAIFLLSKEDWSTVRQEQSLEESHG